MEPFEDEPGAPKAWHYAPEGGCIHEVAIFDEPMSCKEHVAARLRGMKREWEECAGSEGSDLGFPVAGFDAVIEATENL